MISYPSIDTANNNKYMKQVNEKDIELFVVTEKIHGTNLSVIINDNELIYARREGIIDDYFYNYLYTMQKLEDTYKRIYEYLKSIYNCNSIQIVGEFAGGGYPHPNASHLFDKNYKLVQQEIYYAPFNFHYVFDIIVDDKYLDYIELQSICEAFKLIYAYPLFIGTLEKCLQYPNNTISVLSAYFMKDSIIDNNICEGNVIRPLYESKLNNNDRVIIKHKNEQWSEVKKDIDPILLSKITGEYIDDNTKLLLEEAIKYITKNRLLNVLSNMNDNAKKNINAVTGKFVSDIVKDFGKDFEEYNNLDTKQRKYISTNLNNISAEFIKTNYNNE